MFRRILLEDWMSIFVIIAFVTALSIYLSIFYRAVRMRRSQVQHFANLPFDDQPASASDRHE